MDSLAKISRITVLSAFVMLIIVAFVKFKIDQIPDTPEITFNHDYDEIAKIGILNVALEENATEYCIYNATPRGFQLETFEDFCNAHELELNIIRSANERQSEKLLAEGQCDIIVKHTSKPDSCCMSEPLISSCLVILSNSKENPDTIYVSGLQKFCTKYKGHIIIGTDSLSQENLARSVASNKISAAICDSALALAYQKAYPRLEIDTSIHFAQNIVWKTHPEARFLRDSINTWLAKERETKHFKLRHEIYYSYINIKVSSNYYSGNGNIICVYDDIIKKHSKKLNWDWRYITSLIYEESHFIPDISNPSGAYGLMQLMPAAYQKFMHDSADISNPEIQIIAGINHIAYLKKRAPESITDTAVIIRFILMGYNAGLGHADDAFFLAQKYANNPNSWKSLSEYMKLLNDHKYYTDSVVKCGKYRGSRTVVFTNNVINRYKHYRNLIE